VLRPEREVARRDTDSWSQMAGPIFKRAAESANTEFVPRGLRGKAPAAAAAMLYGRAVGLPPMTALNGTHVIDGMAVALLADPQGCARWSWDTSGHEVSGFARAPVRGPAACAPGPTGAAAPRSWDNKTTTSERRPWRAFGRPAREVRLSPASRLVPAGACVQARVVPPSSANWRSPYIVHETSRPPYRSCRFTRPDQAAVPVAEVRTDRALEVYAECTASGRVAGPGRGRAKTSPRPLRPGYGWPRRGPAAATRWQPDLEMSL
jgi:hypothetical protein